MTLVDPNTGEVRSLARAWADLRTRAEDARHAAPETPEAIDHELRAVESLGFEVADFYRTALDEQYDAEKFHSAVKNKALAKHSESKRSVAAARALAEVDAADAYGDWLNKKAIVKHVHEILQALRSKHIGLQSTKRGIDSMIGSAHRRGA